MTERTKPADTTEENDESGKDGAQQIVDFGSALTKTPHGSVYCMTIIGQIEGPQHRRQRCQDHQVRACAAPAGQAGGERRGERRPLPAEYRGR